jgi:ActR/RegA family two-component response regulator
MSVQTLLVVDDDLAFVFWLGFGLDEHGLQTVPAKNSTAARALLGRITFPLRAAIVNAALPGTARLVKDLRRRQPDLTVISLEGSAAGPLAGSDAALARPTELDAAAKAEWVRAILSPGLEVRTAP